MLVICPGYSILLFHDIADLLCYHYVMYATMWSYIIFTGLWYVHKTKSNHVCKLGSHIQSLYYSSLYILINWIIFFFFIYITSHYDLVTFILFRIRLHFIVMVQNIQRKFILQQFFSCAFSNMTPKRICLNLTVFLSCPFFFFFFF